MSPRRAVAALAVLVVLALPGTAAAHGSHHDRPPDLGPNVKVFDPSMHRRDPGDGRRDRRPAGTTRWAPTASAAVQAGHLRHAADPLNFKVGYYTEVAGLGASPADVDDQRHRSTSTTGA